MSIRRARSKAHTQNAPSRVAHDESSADWNAPDRGQARLSRDQAQLDRDREIAIPTDLRNAARLQQRQRDIDGRRGRPFGPVREPIVVSPTAKNPRVTPDEPRIPDEPASSASVVPSATPVPHNRPRLIIADDDPVICSMLEMSLSDGFDVVGVAADSEDAIELARERQPDAAVIDVEMPKGGGLSAVRGILDVAPATAIVVLSVDESDTVVRELIQAGAMAYVRKGSAPQALANSLTESIRAQAHWARNAPSSATPQRTHASAG